MTTWTRVRHYIGSAWSYLWAPPRDENRLGGVYPAIFGTAAMVILMSIVVMPFGVLAAFYLREYGRPGPFLNAVRIAVNSLAGVPSIVFGVFGLGFFVYFLGGTLDRWFFAADLPEPTLGRGGILWCSLTLALLTLPVVIVAVEEGLAGVPPGIREASHALGATRFETLWRVVVPVVLPSMLTGLILSMARAAGTVAPLMITGAVAFSAELPVDGAWPFRAPGTRVHAPWVSYLRHGFQAGWRRGVSTHGVYVHPVAAGHRGRAERGGDRAQRAG